MAVSCGLAGAVGMVVDSVVGVLVIVVTVAVTAVAVIVVFVGVVMMMLGMIHVTSLTVTALNRRTRPGFIASGAPEFKELPST
jgi:hypothetical protein